MTIWSYLPWALPPLPALPSFLNLSLPPNLQKRFVSYLLKRSLGRFVKGGGLDVEKVEGQISQGRLELDKLELDIEVSNFHSHRCHRDIVN
jgi:autophagy-related protein 2